MKRFKATLAGLRGLGGLTGLALLIAAMGCGGTAPVTASNDPVLLSNHPAMLKNNRDVKVDVVPEAMLAEQFKRWAALDSYIKANSWIRWNDNPKREWLEELRSTLIKALEYRPEIVDNWEYLGHICYKLKRYSESASAYGTWLAMAPEEVRESDYYRIAKANAYTGDYEAAAKMMREANRLEPTTAKHKWVVVFSFGHGGLPAAAEVWREQHPNAFASSGQFHKEEYKAFNSIYGGMRKLAKEAKLAEAHFAVLKHYSKLFALESVIAWRYFHEEAPSWLGPGIYNELERKALDEVVSAYGRLPVKPAPPPAAVRHVVEGQTHMKRKRWDEAEASYRKSIVIAPWWPEVHYNSALLMSHKMGGLKAAVIEMELFLRLAPDTDRAGDARSKMQEWRVAIHAFADEDILIRDDGLAPAAPDRRHY